MAKDSNIVQLNLSDYTPVLSSEKVDRGGYVASGEDNLFPTYLRELSETSPIHGALCISIADMIAGKGLDAGQYQQRVDSLGTYDVFYGCAHDLKKYGGFYIEIIYTLDKKKIAKLNHLPYEECRIAVEGDDETHTGIYHSADWANVRKKKNKPVYVPRFNPANAATEAKQVLWCFDYTSGKTYPKPDYWSAVNYIELSKQIGIYHVSNILNGLFPSMVVSFYNGQLEPEEIQKVRNEWDRNLSGARNSGKAIFLFNEANAQRPEITAFPISDADKQYEYLTATSRQEILCAHRCTTPLIFGIKDGGSGFGNNKDEMVVGLEIFTKQVIEPRQRKLADALQSILSFEMADIEISVIPNTPLELPTATVSADASKNAADAKQGAETATPTDTTAVNYAAASADVASTALNSAQISSMLEVLIQAATGVLPVPSAKAVMAASFPTLTPQQIEDIFTGISAGSVNPDQIAMAAFKKAVHTLTAEKKKYSESDLASELIALGEDITDEWICVDEYNVDYDNDELENDYLEQLNKVALASTGVSTGTARPNANSGQDDKIDGRMYKVRYRYKGSISTNSRDFCRAMVNADKLYRKEDIEAMGEKAVNAGFGYRGADTYSIWLYKGGPYCGHAWSKSIWISAKGFNIDVTAADAKANAEAVARKAGYVVRNNPKVATPPFDMPNYGFHPNNPRFNK